MGVMDEAFGGCGGAAADHQQGGKFVIPKAGCHVIGRRATGPTSDLIVMIYCSKVYDHYIFLNRTRAADVTTEPLF